MYIVVIEDIHHFQEKYSMNILKIVNSRIDCLTTI